MVIGGIKDWAVTKIITAAITKLATMLNPAGAIIQAIIAVYNTVAFFIERINQILALVESIVDSIASIAAGKLEQAANFVERTMARTLPVILGFLGRLIGLGDVSGAIKNVIQTIQTKVDAAIDKMIAWIVEKATQLFGKSKEEPTDPKWAAAVTGVHDALEKLEEGGQLDDAKVQDSLPAWKTQFGFTDLKVEVKDDGHEIMGAMSPHKPVAKMGRDGTHTHPFPLAYPKPKNRYNTIYLGPANSPARTQTDLKKAYDNPVTRAAQQIDKFVAFPSGAQALGGKPFGIQGKHALGLGDKVGPLTTAGTTGGYLINDRLDKYGFDRAHEKVEGDHFWEIQFGGENVIENLWPLDEDINGKSGNYLKNLEVTLPSGKKKKVPELKAATRKYWFEITSFKEP